MESGKCYIGSATDLSKRFRNYYNLSYLETHKNKSIIYKALLKYGYHKFSLGILEYCDINVLIEREQYYMDSLKPEYNICKIAGSSLGFKHSEATKAKMRVNNTGKKHTSETRKKIGQSLQSIKVNNIPRVIKPETIIKISSRCHGVRVKAYDKSNNLIKIFPTIISAAKYFNISTKTLALTLKTGISYDGNFILKFELKDTRIRVYDCNRELINIFDNVFKASVWCNIPYTSMTRYIKSGKLYKNKYYFYNINY